MSLIRTINVNTQGHIQMCLILKCPHFRVLVKRSSTVYRGVLISGCWNRGISQYKEVSSFQRVGIDGFHFIILQSH